MPLTVCQLRHNTILQIEVEKERIFDFQTDGKLPNYGIDTITAILFSIIALPVQARTTNVEGHPTA